jgi:hypothetical protein
MMRTETVARAVTSLVEIIVHAPKCVRVTSTISTDMVGREVTSFEIDVHHSDRGRLIGERWSKHAGIARPLELGRVRLVRAVSRKLQRRIGRGAHP